MSLRSLSENLAAALVRAEAREGGPKPPPPPAFTIALSREVGARGTTVAREMGERLGWPVYDNEIMERLACEMKLHPRRLEGLDEKHGNLLTEFVESFSTAPGVSEDAYVRRLIRTLLALGAQGSCIIVGRGAAQLLSPETTLRVRLVADRDDRIGVMSQRLGVPRPEAARYVEKKDRERDLFVKHHLHKDAADPRLYDLVLNSTRFSVGECADIILEALRRLQGRAAASPPLTSREARP
jgi:cytidylate kinase